MRANDYALNMQKKSYVNFVMITSLTQVIYPCSVFLLDFFCSNDQKQATSSPTHISPSHQKWQNITRSWPKMDLSSYVEPLCVCVCQVGLWFLSTRMSQHANSFVNFTLFLWWGVLEQYTKTLKRRKLTSHLWAAWRQP